MRILGILLFIFTAATVCTQPYEAQYEWEWKAGLYCMASFYSDHIIRFQFREAGQAYLPDDHYEMVLSHDKGGQFRQSEKASAPAFFCPGSRLSVESQNGRLVLLGNGVPLFTVEQFESNDSLKRVVAHYDPSEHFCGLGHQSYGLVESLDLAGKEASSNYGEGKVKDWGPQGVLTVPFFMSSKGYGIFLNTAFPHRFTFGKEGAFSFQLEDGSFEGRMDFFFIYGPALRDVLNHYTQLTGQPVMLPQSVFGLQLSDKGFPENEGMEWWVQKVKAHREAGFALDHITHDNRWRAGSGAWSGSWFEWDSTRYPQPGLFAAWAKEQGLTMTLDLNRNIIAASKGYQPAFNLPHSEAFIKEGYSAPDFTRPEARQWIWALFWEQSLDPALGYPGDGLWLDETDELHTLPDTVIAANGWAWKELANYYNFLLAKAVVEEGWFGKKGLAPQKRPFVWQRALSAGAQRWSTHWSGDLKCSYDWMAGNIRGMLASGLSGFPYFNHDAGGFRGGPDGPMYRQWAMAFGSFSPIWRPHGFGDRKRWPLNRTERDQAAAIKYMRLRYSWMPYLYTYAHEAHEKGLPIARAMMLEYPAEADAWKFDLQYLWGRDMLIAPTHSDWDTRLNIWLPPGEDWVYYWNDVLYPGGQAIEFEASTEELPIFIRRGAIIPGRRYAQSIAFIDEAHLTLDIYTGKDGAFELYEDDGISMAFQDGASRKTQLAYSEEGRQLSIGAARGAYAGCPDARSYELRFHLLEEPPVAILLEGAPLDTRRFTWKDGTLTVRLEARSVEGPLALSLEY